jgi:hypothetical protein
MMGLLVLFFRSGVVPGEEDGGRWSSPSLELGGVTYGHDCIFSKLSEVLSLYFKDLGVI